MQLTEDIKRAVMREMGSKGGKTHSKKHMKKLSELAVIARKNKRLEKLSTGIP